MFKGIITAMITPMKNEEINYPAMEKHIDYLINQGVHGLFILGTNGEFHVLSDDEKYNYAKAVVAHVAGRIPVYVGVGACGTKETITLAKRMATLNPQALTVITPYLVKISQKELEEHFRQIAHAVDLPIILYNIPANTGINISAEVVKNLADCKNILGIKDSSGDMENLKSYLDNTDSSFSVLVGSDSKVLAALKLGAVGAVASTSNAIGKHVVQLYNSFLEGKSEEAEMLQKDIDVIRGVLKLASVPAIIKRCVSLQGNDVGEARFPVESIGEKYDAEIREVLRFYNLI